MIGGEIMGFPIGWWIAIMIQVIVFVLMLSTRDKMDQGEQE